MKLKYTRAMITAVKRRLEYKYHAVFGLAIPQTCPDVPDILNQSKTWSDATLYDQKSS
jgi:phosphoenolpyruvate carboxykinase (ATP)